MSKFSTSRINCSALAKAQTEAQETFDDLKKSIESFQSKIWAVGIKAKRKKLQDLRQMMIHDMFN
jgi:hypothetical protein